MKKALVLLAALVFLGVNIFADIESSRTLFEDAKLFIELNRHLQPMGGSKYYRNDSIFMKNYTNYEMEVKINYTIDMQYDKSATSKRDTTEKFTNQIVKLKPHESKSIVATNLYGNGNITNFELVNYRVIEKNYEIR